MRIVITGNPLYEGLCSGIWEAYARNQVEFIGRWNDWDLTDADAVAEYVKDHNVFVNSQYGPNGEQVELLRKVYEKFNGEHIINISSTTSYWGDGYNPGDYLKNKTELDELSKKYSQYGTFGSSKIRVSNIAFGQLASQTQLDKSTNNKISLLEAGKLVKWVIDSPRSYNLHYMALDPIQKDL